MATARLISSLYREGDEDTAAAGSARRRRVADGASTGQLADTAQGIDRLDVRCSPRASRPHLWMYRNKALGAVLASRFETCRSEERRADDPEGSDGGSSRHVVSGRPQTIGQRPRYRRHPVRKTLHQVTRLVPVIGAASAKD
jgi:hypothetical protein